jgi:hypothetical protein
MCLFEGKNGRDFRSFTKYILPNLAKALVTAVCRKVGKKIALVLMFFPPEKPHRSSEMARFVATSTARQCYLGLGEVCILQPKTKQKRTLEVLETK